MFWAIVTTVASALSGVVLAAHRFSAPRRAFCRARRSWRLFRRLVDRVNRCEHQAVQELAHAASRYRDRQLRQRIANAPIDDLKTFSGPGIRWTAVRDHGLARVGDLSGASNPQLLSLPGVGPHTVAGLRRALRAHRDHVGEQPTPYPDSDLLEPEAKTLVANAKALVDLRQSKSTFDPDVSELLREADHRTHDLKGRTNFWAWLTGRARGCHQHGLMVECAGLEQRGRETSSGQIALLLARTRQVFRRRRRRNYRPTEKTLRTEYESLRAHYVAVMEPYLGRSRAGAENTALLPEDVLAKINGIELRLNGLRVTLRGYQGFATRFMLAQGRTLIGDEMGLGKTIQALAAMVHLRDSDKDRLFLVICPATIVLNWARETADRTNIPTFILKGPKASLEARRWLTTGGLAITSYATITSGDILRRIVASRRTIDLLVADEAHYVKNPEAQRSAASKTAAGLSTRVCLMTGTPIENRLSEFQSIVSVFSDEHALRLRSASENAGEYIPRPRFLKLVAPMYLRRNQEDVLTELPDKIEVDEWIEMLPQDAAAYRDAVFARNFMGMRRAASIGSGSSTSGKIERLAELVQEYEASGRKVVVFTFFLDVLDCVCRRFPGTPLICGSVSPTERMRVIDNFQRSDEFAMLAAQIGVGGVGLNLQAASVVVLVEPQWKPSTENQAIARAYRMGQTRSVMVHRLLALDSVDQRMIETLAQKQALFDEYARESTLKHASPEATERGLMEQIINQEHERLQGCRQ